MFMYRIKLAQFAVGIFSWECSTSRQLDRPVNRQPTENCNFVIPASLFMCRYIRFCFEIVILFAVICHLGSCKYLSICHSWERLTQMEIFWEGDEKSVSAVDRSQGWRVTILEKNASCHTMETANNGRYFLNESDGYE